MSFSDQNTGYTYEVPGTPDSTFGMADMDDVSLQNFFSRPVKVASYSWGTGTNLYEKFNPWTLFWENLRNLNRITNYNLLRCKLHVKFVLNGNGFHYGRAIASYVPLHAFDTFTKDRSFFIEDVVAASQRPHVYLDPTKSLGGELVLPFVWPFNALDVPDEDWNDMGDVIIHGMQNLKHANGATDQVVVSVFVWATDVVFSTPTANEPDALEAQAGEYTPQADEYGSGPISGPAGVVARAAGALKNIPAIGMYARATELAASSVAHIAKLFGYSRPVTLNEVLPFRPTFLGNMANTNMPDSSVKLSFDPKQELCIDTRTFGLDGTDEMAISSIVTRESFLTNFGWAVADTPETLLWNSEVNPVIWNENTIGGETEYHMPACCFAAMPFKHWRGTMKFRFQVVASAFHKGRLKITYDPSYPATNEYNTNYTRIIDIAEERDFTVEIGWGQQHAYCTRRAMINGAGNIWSTTALGADAGELANGIISVYVVNDLTVPNSTADNDIELNVFVSAGEDLELANPTDQYVRDMSWFVPQSGEYTPQAGEDMGSNPDGDNTQQESAPMRTEPDESIAAPVSSVDHAGCVFFGDPVVSIRQLLKRYNYSKAFVPAQDSTGYRVYRWLISNFPLHRGYAPGAVNEVTTPANPTDYNFCKMTMLNYFVPAYTCWRGGLRWKYQAVYDNSDACSYMAVFREPTPQFGYSQGSIALSDETTSVSTRTSEWDEAINTNFFPGAQVTSAAQNPVVEIELPYFNNHRFAYAKQANVADLNPGGDTLFHWLHMKQNVNTGSYEAILAHCATGEDFTLGFFTGAPVAYYQANPTAA